MDTNMLKKQVRTDIRAELKKHSLEELHVFSSSIKTKIEQLNCFNEAKNIMIYWSMPYEVETHKAVEEWGTYKNIYLPCIEGDILTPKQYSATNELVPASPMQIPEPTTGNSINPSNLDLIIVPGLAFDKSNNRLGKGKGYYDKFLLSTNAYKIGICFHFQLINHVPVSSFDIAMDLTITN